MAVYDEEDNPNLIRPDDKLEIPKTDDEVIDRQQLEDSERSGGTNPLSSSTGKGRINYTGTSSGNSGTGSYSTPTSSGNIRYTPEVPQAEASLYNSSPTKNGKVGFGSLFGTRRRKIIGVGAGMAAGGILGFLLFFLPTLRLESYLSSINTRAFAGAESAVTHRLENLTERFMILRMIHIQRCGARVTNDCAADYTKHGIAGSMFNTWRDANIEKTILDKAGIKIESLKYPRANGQRFILRDRDGREITLSDGEIKEGKFLGGNRAMGDELNRFMRNETHALQFLQRRSVRKWGVRKHGMKFWCFWACATKDNIDNKVSTIPERFKYRLIERTVLPFSPKLGFIMECLINSDKNCSTKELRAKGIAREQISDKEIEAIQKRIADEPGTRLSRLAAEWMLQKITLGAISAETAKKAVGALGPVGLVYLALSGMEFATNLDDFIKNDGLSHFAADLNSRQYLEFYTVMRSANDEMKAGVLDTEQVHVLLDQFEGDHPAEESKIYKAYNNSSSTIALFGNKAYAAESNKVSEYLCNDNKPVPKNEKVCPEKKIARKFNIEAFRDDGVINFFINNINKYKCFVYLPRIGCKFGPRDFIRPVLKTISNVSNYVLGPIVRAAISAVMKIPFIGGWINSLVDKIAEMFTIILERFFELPVAIDSPGREKYDGLEAGAEVAASEFSKGGYTDDGKAYGLGGQRLSSAQQAAVLEDYAKIKQSDYSHQSFFAKLTNREYPQSFANRFIAIMPNRLSQFPSHFGYMLKNSFSSIFTKPAYAGGVQLATSPFGEPHNGYTANDPAYTADPTKLTKARCDNQIKNAWLKSQTEDKATGFEEYTTTNPCLLEYTVVETGTSGITGNDCADDDPCPNANPNPSGGGTTTSGSCNSGGKYSALVGEGASFAGVDQGIDFVPASGAKGFDICTPASGTITLADQSGHHFARTPGEAEIILQMDKPSGVPSSSGYIYFAEIIKIDSNIKVGVHIDKGTLIGHNDASPGIEAGWAPNATHGFMCSLGSSLGSSTPCGESFNNWVIAGGGQ